MVLVHTHACMHCTHIRTHSHKHPLSHTYTSSQEKERLLRETEEREKQHLNNIMLEERTWYCGFVAAYSKSLDIESSMYSEVDRLNSSLQDLSAAITQPTELPDIAKEFIKVYNDYILSWRYIVHVMKGFNVQLLLSVCVYVGYNVLFSVLVQCMCTLDCKLAMAEWAMWMLCACCTNSLTPKHNSIS